MAFRAALVAVATAYAALGIVPLLWTYGSALWDRSQDVFGLATSPATWRALGRSAALGALVAFGASALAAPLAFLTGRTSCRGRHILAAAALIPLALPPYNLALALRGWLPRDPLVASSLVLSMALYPIPFVFLRAGLSSIDAGLEQAALVARGRLPTLAGITWPLVRPWAIAAAGIVFLLGLGEFAAPAYLGLPVYSGQIVLRFAASYDASAAAVAALPLAGAVVILLAAESAVLRRVEVFTGRLRAPLTYELGALWLPVQLSCLTILFLSPGLPLLLTVLAIDRDGLSRALPMIIRPALNSLTIAGTGCAGALVVAVAVALLVRRGIRLYRWVSLSLFVIPGAVLGIALIGFWNHAAMPPLYGTMGLVVVAVVLRYSVLAERAIDLGLSRVPVAQEEAARLAGRSQPAIALRILFPQIQAAIVAGVVAFLLFTFRDLDTVVTIYPPGSETLAVRLYTVLANSPRGLQAALSLAQATLTLPVVLLLVLTLRKSRWMF